MPESRHEGAAPLGGGQGRRTLAHERLDARPGACLGHIVADSRRQVEQHVARRPRIVERGDHRLNHAPYRKRNARRRCRILPPLQVSVVGQHQVGVARALVEKRRERDHERDPLQRLPHPVRLRRGRQRIGVVQEQHFESGGRAFENPVGPVGGVHAGARRLRPRRAGQLVERRKLRRPLHVDASGALERAGEHVEGVDRQRIGQAPAAPGDDLVPQRERALGPAELLGQPDDALDRQANAFRHALRPAVTEDQAAVARNLVAGLVGPILEPLHAVVNPLGVVQALLEQHVGDAERQGPVASRPYRQPLVGCGGRA